jgi:hypothetical protein
MFVARQASVLCDHLRVPYRVDGAATPRALTFDGHTRALRWPDTTDDRLGAYRLDGIPFFAALRDAGEGVEIAPVTDADGTHVAAVRRTADGSICLPFDPDEAIVACWSERYAEATAGAATSGLKRVAMRGYYAARPMMPRALQIWLRRGFARVQARTAFPRWPVETALHDLLGFLLRQLATVADEPVPWLSPWPDGKQWALVLTHDVEHQVGHDNVHLLADVERELGLRSSWNFVARRYTVSDEVVAGLRDDGFEVGVHGLYHDGRDLESFQTLQERLPEMRAHAERWGAVGFRSPATHRNWEWMPMLGFDYDTSYPDTDPFEPQGGGCCSWLPFFNRELVELPITLPQDHTLFVILREDERRWVEKTDFLREHGGMALLNTHPDYMLEPERVAQYDRYLRPLAADETAWHVLPRNASAWWRRRAATQPLRDGSGWRAESDATVVLAEP